MKQEITRRRRRGRGRERKSRVGREKKEKKKKKRYDRHVKKCQRREKAMVLTFSSSFSSSLSNIELEDIEKTSLKSILLSTDFFFSFQSCICKNSFSRLFCQCFFFLLLLSLVFVDVKIGSKRFLCLVIGVKSSVSFSCVEKHR